MCNTEQVKYRMRSKEEPRNTDRLCNYESGLSTFMEADWCDSSIFVFLIVTNT